MSAELAKKSPPRMQCKACPWRKATVPGKDIPGGYCETKHKGLEKTIAPPGALIFEAGPMMACHEYPPGKEKPCVGWIAHQLGPGNNIALRIAARFGGFDANVRTVGEQHERFENTLPTGHRRRGLSHARRDDTMTTIDLTATEPTIDWPESLDTPPDGWHWGRHVSLGARGTGYYMIRDRDGAAVIAMQRPDLSDDDAPTKGELQAALSASATEAE